MKNWDHEYDFVVAGSGGGGMTAALVAKLNGLNSLLLEKTNYYGGSTALSGGGIWAPGSYLMAEADIPDSIENGLLYLEDTVGNRVPKSKLKAYVTKVNEMMEYLKKNTHVEFQIMHGYPDYYPESPGGTDGGRALEPVLFEGKKLGRIFDEMRPHPYLPPPLAFTLVDWKRVSMSRSDPLNIIKSLGFFFRTFINIILRKKHRTFGLALIASLRLSLHEQDVPVWLNSSVKDLIVEDGKITGVEIERNNKALRIRAKKGVVFAAGGFAHNKKMREKHFRQPANTKWTSACEGNTGDAIQIGIKAGAAVDLMDDAWWGPTTTAFDGPPLFLVMERSYPGAILVNSKGERFVNESAPYIDVVHAMYNENSNDSVSIPAHFIMGHRYRSNYFFGILPPGITPKKYIEQGHVNKAESLEELATQIGVDPQGLIKTLKKYNKFTMTGKDEDFKRGDSIYDRFYSDPKVKPNSCLAPIDKPPYYSIKIYPGDLGTKGGLVTNEYAQVLKDDGSVIKGLYAIGNTSASIMGNSYPGPGVTIGPSMTFGYIAAIHASKG